MKYVFFVLLRATPAWLRLPREQRRDASAQHLQPLLGPESGVRVRHFDAVAFTAQCSDVMMVETDDPRRHFFFMERLRDSPLVTVPYFEVVQVIPAIEDGYTEFERVTGQAGEV